MASARLLAALLTLEASLDGFSVDIMGHIVLVGVVHLRFISEGSAVEHLCAYEGPATQAGVDLFRHCANARHAKRLVLHLKTQS